MYKQVKIFAVLIVVVPALFGQINNFEFVQHDTIYTGSEEFVVLEGDIFSFSDAVQSITVTRITHEIPGTWTNSFCVGPACLPPFLDTFTFDLAAHDTALFTLDTYHNGEIGVGSWTIFAVDSSTMEIDSVQISMEVVTVSIDNAYEKPATFKLSSIYPNPSNAWVNFDLSLQNGGEYSVVLYALDGREILSRHYSFQAGKNHLQWGLEGLPSGNYIISASGLGQTVSRQLSVIK
ncbi:MAG: T9SS type A sorting domain-containing protein [Candidatus Marinimicrobia bacterium]|nr:T9SS type A sorting domain-containing protein [Candidatus Neomarinimicrobiota bacterium]